MVWRAVAHPIGIESSSSSSSTLGSMLRAVDCSSPLNPIPNFKFSKKKKKGNTCLACTRSHFRLREGCSCCSLICVWRCACMCVCIPLECLISMKASRGNWTSWNLSQLPQIFMGLPNTYMFGLLCNFCMALLPLWAPVDWVSSMG